jgi:predicted nucleotidyltransferase
VTTPVSPVDTTRHLARLARERRERAAERAQRLRERLPAAARLLREIHGAERVLLFGSLTTGSYCETSDVDLGVEGLAG